MQLRSGVAVALAASYSSDSTRSLGTTICPGCSPKKKKKKNTITESFEGRQSSYSLSKFMIYI